jgi:hypothetical protein
MRDLVIGTNRPSTHPIARLPVTQSPMYRSLQLKERHAGTAGMA